MASKQKVIETFHQQFTKEPRVFFSPGRINLIGEHIDYNDGFVMPAAIDKGVWFAIAENKSDAVRFYSADMHESHTSELNSIIPNEGWKNYVLGVLHVLQAKGFTLKGFDCAFGGNLPVGAGLSSSAAVECGLIYALNELFQLGLERKQLALMAQQAEHSFPGVKCGIMDQFASMNGKKNHVMLLDCRTIEHQYFPLELEEYKLVLINSKMHHSLASGEYNVRRQQCADGLSIMQKHRPEIKTFREATVEDVEACKENMNKDVYRRCLYVVQEIKRTRQAAEHLQKKELKEFGKLMFETHEGLSKLYDVSCPELDFLVLQAKDHPEIIGSRLMGGGFGGCTINIIQKENAQQIVEQILSDYSRNFEVEAEVYEVKTGDGSHEILITE